MFTGMSIDLYDKLYAAQNKDYSKEADYLLSVITSKGMPADRLLLDVACGTGRHLECLKSHFDCEGLDIAPRFIELAKQRNPELAFYVGDMRTFSTGKRYGVVTCLFSSIGYMTTSADLVHAIQNMGNHLTDDGLLLVEPWLLPEKWKTGKVSMTILNEEALKVVRMNTTWEANGISAFDFHYLVATPAGVDHFVEEHRAKLTSVEEMLEAHAKAGLQAEYDAKGPTGRGLYISRRKQGR